MLAHIRRARQVFAEEGALKLVRAVIGYFLGLYNSARKRVRTWLLIRREGAIVEREVNGYRMQLDLQKGGICSSIAFDNVYDKETTRVFTGVLDELHERYDDVFVLDIGANIGYYALLEAHRLGSTGRIHAFEPSPENVDMLETNVELNDFEELVTVHQESVGDEPGTGELNLAAKPNSHFMDGVTKPRSTVETIEVEVVTVDDVIEDHVADPSTPVVVRMDVEGYEAKVFEGMNELLNSDRPAVVMVELHPMVPADELDSMLANLESAGFELTYAGDGATDFSDIDVSVGSTVNMIAERE